MAGSKRAVIVTTHRQHKQHDNDIKKVQNYLSAQGYQTEFAYYDEMSKKELKNLLTDENTGFLVTTNLQGFELGTVSGGLWYNFLPYRSIHLLWEQEWKTNLPDHPVRLSISLFFFLFGQEKEERKLKEEFDFPYFQRLESPEQLEAELLSLRHSINGA